VSETSSVPPKPNTLLTFNSEVPEKIILSLNCSAVLPNGALSKTNVSTNTTFPLSSHFSDSFHTSDSLRFSDSLHLSDSNNSFDSPSVSDLVKFLVSPNSSDTGNGDSVPDSALLNEIRFVSSNSKVSEKSRVFSNHSEKENFTDFEY
jgi:hypothetical protein